MLLNKNYIRSQIGGGTCTAMSGYSYTNISTVSIPYQFTDRVRDIDTAVHDANYTIGGVQIVVGTGNTIETVDDNTIEFISDNVLSAQHNLIKHASDNPNMVVVRTATFTNITENDNITIREVGLAHCYSSGKKIYTAYNNSAHDSYLIAREVLDTPVTIAPGETVTFSYTFNFLPEANN